MARKKDNSNDLDDDEGDTEIAILLQEIQVFLAQKRTSLAELRTGIMIITLPMSVFTVLVATSDYYNVFKVFPLFSTLVAVSVGLLVFASYLIVRSLKKIFFVEKQIMELRKKSPFIRKTFKTGRFIPVSVGKKK